MNELTISIFQLDDGTKKKWKWFRKQPLSVVDVHIHAPRRIYSESRLIELYNGLVTRDYTITHRACQRLEYGTTIVVILDANHIGAVYLRIN